MVSAVPLLLTMSEADDAHITIEQREQAAIAAATERELVANAWALVPSLHAQTCRGPKLPCSGAHRPRSPFDAI